MLHLLVLLAAGGLASIWVAYPLVVMGVATVVRVARSRRATRLSEPSGSSVSIVLATREDADAIRARVDNLLACASGKARLEVVIAMDRDATGIGAASLGLPADRVTIVSGDAPGGKASALNAGVRASRGEVLVFADTHQRFGVDAIDQLVRPFADARVAAASGRLELQEGRSRSMVEWYWRLERALRRHEAILHSPIGVTGAIWAMRRALWQPLPAGLILDDVYTPMRLVLEGHRVAFADEARAWETRRPIAAQEYHRKVRTLTGVIQLCAWLPAVLVPFRNPVWLQFVFHKLMRFLTPYLLALLIIALGILTVRSLTGWQLGILGVFAVVVIAIARLADIPFLRRGREIVASTLALQVAVIMSTVNGARGRWDVWRS